MLRGIFKGGGATERERVMLEDRKEEANKGEEDD